MNDNSTIALKVFLGLTHWKDNHRQDQRAYICKKCGKWSCTRNSDRVGNVLYICPHCREYNHIDDIKKQNITQYIV